MLALPLDQIDLASLNGAFLSVRISQNERDLALCNDRFGHYPLYQYEDAEVLAFSTHLAALLQWMRRPTIDIESLNVFLRTGELLDESTLVSGVRFIRGATRLTVRDGAIDRKTYWNTRIEPDRSISFPTASEECGQLLKRAVQRVCAANHRVGVPLSGGLDSRFLLGLCPNPTVVPSFTMGLNGCRDVRFAMQFARRIASPHTVYLWEPELFPKLWPEGVRESGGSIGIGDMFMLPYAARFADACDVTLNGLAGDALLGGNFIKLRWLRSRSIEELARWTWDWRVGEAVNASVDSLVGPSHTAGDAFDRWQASVSQEPGTTPSLSLLAWLSRNRVFRFTNCGTALLRRHVESHAPFFDHDLFDFLSRVPVIYRYKHRLYIDCIKKACPTAAAVPWQRTRLAPSWGFAANSTAMLVHKFVGLVDRRCGTQFLGDMRVADVPNWFRSGAWSAPAFELLTSDRCLERGLYKPDAIRAVLDSHRAGVDHTSVISRVVTVELLARQLEAKVATQAASTQLAEA